MPAGRGSPAGDLSGAASISPEIAALRKIVLEYTRQASELSFAWHRFNAVHETA
jgi:hypothetical protein